MFILAKDTKIEDAIGTKPTENAVAILRRDMDKTLDGEGGGRIALQLDASVDAESWRLEVTEECAHIYAGGDLGFVYGLLYISEKYLGIKPFWFWLDQRIEKKGTVTIPEGVYEMQRPVVRFRGWFFNDEVLMLKWHAGHDREYVWRMAFEVLLRCGGNMTIPGTDKNSRLNRGLASEMGLWITHHHAEPLGAELFARAYPGVEASYFKNPQLFERLWEEAVIAQKDCKVVWNLCFRGQGDKPFWADDTSGQYDTPEKQGALITSLIKKQCDIVRKYVKDSIFCTNLYGEIMELYSQGHIELSPEVIKVRADNGYGKMVTRRRDNHSARVSSMPVKGEGSQGIYYHVSFYDLQAANHITMLPNSVDFVNRELSEVLANDGDDFWVVNCSNVRPHAYYLDAVRKKWFGRTVSDEEHSRSFADEYYGSSEEAAECLREYPRAMIQFGEHEDEHAGEQFYTENVRIVANRFIKDRQAPTPALYWIAGDKDLYSQAENLDRICAGGLDKLRSYLKLCEKTSVAISGDHKSIFDSTILLQAKLHTYCAEGMDMFLQAVEKFREKKYKESFLLAGDSAEKFSAADKAMRDSEYGLWKGYYSNDCFADVKHSAYMAEKVMGVIREFGDNIRHDKWYRETVYAPEDREVFLLLVEDNHMTDRELYEAMKEEQA